MGDWFKYVNKMLVAPFFGIRIPDEVLVNYPQVRTKLRETCIRLMRDIPNIRIGIMANGDYCDSYVVRYHDLTTDVESIVDFAKGVPSTGGGGNGGEVRIYKGA